MSASQSPYAPACGATVHQLQIKPLFDALETREKFYAHHLARAAWHGTRIVMRQVSPESPGIFDFILNIFHACGGNWEALSAKCDVSSEDLDVFLEYAATFLCNLGNFYGEGDQKFVPGVTVDVLEKIASIAPTTQEHLKTIIGPMLAVPPFSLGYPGKNAQSGYYPSENIITRDDIDKLSQIMNENSIGPENTRVQKIVEGGKPVLQLLQASALAQMPTNRISKLADDVVFARGDHSEELAKVCACLEQAKDYVSNEKQSKMLMHYIECFRTGSLEAFQKSQKVWVQDAAARVENIMGFIEPYRDPAGVRAEWEAMIGIADADEAKQLQEFVDKSSNFIRKLPWAVDGVNDGKGPFEKSLFEAPDFTSVHALAVCGSIVFEAANLPNYEYIRETCGFKNGILANRLSVNNNPDLPCYWIDAPELKFFKSTTHIVRSLTTAIHELIGHGTGKLLSEISTGVYNFDKQNPPTNPLDGKAITSFYRPGQTWGSVFGKLAGTVEECRAILMSEYLMDDQDLLGIFGFTDHSDITAEDLLYATYLNIGTEGIQALEHYNIEDQAWGQVHRQAHFSILKYLLRDGDGVITIQHNSKQQSLTVCVDKSKILSHGKPALGRYLCRLHIWRCTADVSACRELYEAMCAVDGDFLQWHKIVKSKPAERWKFVQPNTVISGHDIEIKVYEASNKGIIQSWVDRDV